MPKRGRSSSLTSASSVVEREEAAVFIFRRDFRLVDNTALLSLVEKADVAKLRILPVFFFNPVQCDKKKNPYFGESCFRFLCESLIDLNGENQLNGRLLCLRGTDEECLRRIEEAGYAIKLAGYNEDFTPFATARDQKLQQWATCARVECVTSAADYTLLAPDLVVNGSGLPYSVFTPFSKCFLAEHAKKVPRPAATSVSSILRSFASSGRSRLEKHLVDPAQLCPPSPHTGLVTDVGGRVAGLVRMGSIQNLKNYGNERDYVAHDKTSHLSPHLKFGTVSIREVWYRSVQDLGVQHPFVRQLIWREFYAALTTAHPRLLQGQLNTFIGDASITQSKTPLLNMPFQAKYASFEWKWDEKEFAAFRAGQTGVPLVDAAVRCLTATGWCHNRCRMVIANFAVKVLFVDWRECEKWYATVAVDYDAPNNSGGWLWSSGQGADAQPYFRTFNPFRQSERFDRDCEFIYTWIPELKGVPTKIIHSWDEYCANVRDAKLGLAKEAGKKTKRNAQVFDTAYPSPIVDIKARTQNVIAEFKKYDPVK